MTNDRPSNIRRPRNGGKSRSEGESLPNAPGALGALGAPTAPAPLLKQVKDELEVLRSRQREMYELMLSYKNDLHELKSAVVEALKGLPQSPYIAGRLIPAPRTRDGVELFEDMIEVYLHRQRGAVETPPATVVDEDVAHPLGEEDEDLEDDGEDTETGVAHTKGRRSRRRRSRRDESATESEAGTAKATSPKAGVAAERLSGEGSDDSDDDSAESDESVVVKTEHRDIDEDTAVIEREELIEGEAAAAKAAEAAGEDEEEDYDEDEDGDDEDERASGAGDDEDDEDDELEDDGDLDEVDERPRSHEFASPPTPKAAVQVTAATVAETKEDLAGDDDAGEEEETPPKTQAGSPPVSAAAPSPGGGNEGGRRRRGRRRPRGRPSGGES